jgi:hypothetical protein
MACAPIWQIISLIKRALAKTVFQRMRELEGFFALSSKELPSPFQNSRSKYKKLNII